MILNRISSQVTFLLFNPVFHRQGKELEKPYFGQHRDEKALGPPSLSPPTFFLISKARLKTISLFQFAQTLWESGVRLRSNSPLKILLAVIKPNEKMRCKESQFRVHLNYKVLVQGKYWKLLLLSTTFSFGKL